MLQINFVFQGRKITLFDNKTEKINNIFQKFSKKNYG